MSVLHHIHRFICDMITNTLTNYVIRIFLCLNLWKILLCNHNWPFVIYILRKYIPSNFFALYFRTHMIFTINENTHPFTDMHLYNSILQGILLKGNFPTCFSARLQRKNTILRTCSNLISTTFWRLLYSSVGVLKANKGFHELAIAITQPNLHLTIRLF